jgi:hypothetical protein
VNGIGYFLALLWQVIALMLCPGSLITLLVVGVWVWSWYMSELQIQGQRGRLLMYGCLPPFLLPILILLCGVIFEGVSQRTFQTWDIPPEGATPIEPPQYPLYLIDFLGIFHLPLVAFLVWRYPKGFMVVIASSLLAGYMSLLAIFIATMSITRTWL